MYFEKDELIACLDFARKMKGKHNPNMIMERKDWEIFRDDLRGKLGEIAVQKYMCQEKGEIFSLDKIDFSISERGKWDITDLKEEDKYINVKSIRHNSAFLLIEKKRYNATNGEYVYSNNDGDSVKVDIYALVRVALFKKGDGGKKIDFNYRDYIALKKENYSVEVLKRDRIIYAEILGGIEHKDFWTIKRVANRGIACTVKNLERVWEMKTPELSTEEQRKKKTSTLQVDNYLINEKDLTDINLLLHETEENRFIRKKAMIERYNSIYSKKTNNMYRYKENLICPMCGEGQLVLRNSQYGNFLGCSNFRKLECKFKANIEK